MTILRVMFLWIPAALFDFSAICLILCIGHDFIYFSALGLKPNNHIRGCDCQDCQRNRLKMSRVQDRMIPLLCATITALILFTLWKWG